MIKRKEYDLAYRSGTLMMPAGEKNAAFYLNAAKYYYGQYCSNEAYLGYGGVIRARSIPEIRDRVAGKYNINVFKDQLDPIRKTGKNKNKRRWGISWDPVRILPKFRRIIKSKLDDVRLGVKTTAADPMAQMERVAIKNYAMLLRQPETKMMMGGATIQDDTGLAGMEADDVDFIFRIGGVRLPVEIAMKDAVDKVLLSSKYDLTLKEMLVNDIIDVNICATDTVSNNGVESIRYVDPVGLLIGRSKYPDFRDCGYRGYIEEKSITQVRAESPDLDADMLYQNAMAAYQEVIYRNTQAGIKSDPVVYVLKMYFTSTDVKKFLSGRHRSGGRVFEPVAEDFKVTPKMEKAGKKIEGVPIETLHEFSWVIGTDIIYNYGVVDHIVRKGESGSKEIVWPMSIYGSMETSLMESCIAIDDDLQIATFKLRHLLAKTPPGPRMILYMNLIKDSITVNGENIPISELLADYQAEGTLVLDQTQQYGMPGEEGNGRKPIDFIPTGIQEDFRIHRERVFDCLQNLRFVTGLNEVADGSSMKTDVLKDVMQGLQQATNSALKPMINGLSAHYLSICDYIVNRFKTRLLDGDIDLGYIPLLQDYSRTIKLTKDMAKHDWAIYVEIETGDMLNLLLQDVMQRRDSIPPDSYFLIIRAIEDGDFLKAQYLLASSTERAAKMAHQRQMELVQAQTQGNQEAAQQAAQAQAQLLQLKASIEAQMKEMEARMTAQRDQKLHDYEKEIISEEGAMKYQTSVATVRENNVNRLTQ